MCRKAATVLTLMFCLPWAGPTLAAGAPAFHFALPAQSLADSLRAVGSQAKITIVFTPGLLRGREARALEADLTAAQAVSRLLVGTGFVCRIVNDSTIVVSAGTGKTRGDPPRSMSREAAPVRAAHEISTVAPANTALQAIVVQAKFISTAGFSAMKMNLPARDTPFSISTYTQSFIHAVEAQQVSSLYAYMTGIQSAGTTGYDIVFRGFKSGGNDQNSILVDGLPGLSTRFGSPVTIGLQRIDVVRGPASVMNGEEQPGGFIDLITKKPQARPQYELSATGTAYDGHGIGVGDKPGFDLAADATGPIAGNDHFLYRLVVDDTNRDTFRTYSYDHDLYIAPSFTWRISSADKLTLAYVYQALKYSYDTYLIAPASDINLVAPITTRYQQPSDYGKEHGSALTMFFVHRFANGWTWHLETRDVWHTDQARGFDVTSVRSNLLYVGRRARGQLNKRGYHYVDTHLHMRLVTGPVRHNMVVGLTAGRDSSDFNRTQFYNAPATGPDSLDISLYQPDYNGVPPLSSLPLVAPNHDTLLSDRYTVTENFGAYLADMLTLSKHWKGSIGLRYAYDKQWQHTLYTLTGATLPETVKPAHKVLPMVGLVYQPNGHWSLYASYSTSFVPPSANAIDINGLNDFVPTSANQVEAGIKTAFLRNRLTATLSLYRIDEKNTFSHFKCANYGTCYEQVGKAQSKGAEFEINARPLSNWQLTAGAAYTDAKVTASTVAVQVGSRLPDVPKMAEHLWSRYEFRARALRGFGFGLGVIHVGERTGFTPTKAGPMLMLPGYTRVDTALYYDYKDYTFTFKVTNALDKTYYQSAGFTGDSELLPGAPRMFTLSARAYLQ